MVEALVKGASLYDLVALIHVIIDLRTMTAGQRIDSFEHYIVQYIIVK